MISDTKLDVVCPRCRGQAREVPVSQVEGRVFAGDSRKVWHCARCKTWAPQDPQTRRIIGAMCTNEERVLRDQVRTALKEAKLSREEFRAISGRKPWNDDIDTFGEATCRHVLDQLNATEDLLS